MSQIWVLKHQTRSYTALQNIVVTREIFSYQRKRNEIWSVINFLYAFLFLYFIFKSSPTIDYLNKYLVFYITLHINLVHDLVQSLKQINKLCIQKTRCLVIARNHVRQYTLFAYIIDHGCPYNHASFKTFAFLSICF